MTEPTTAGPAVSGADEPTQVLPPVIPAAPPPPSDHDDDFLDAEWQRPRRTNRLTWILLAAIVAALAFAGGVAVQKGHDAGLVGTAARARTGGGAFGGQGSGAAGAGGAGGDRAGAAGAGGASGDRAGAGGAGGQGSGAGSAGGAGGDRAGADGAAGTGAAGTSTPVAVGTITTVSGQTLTLTDFGGTVVTVHVPATATVTTPGLGGPSVGSPVSVVGTKAADGSVTATAVTVRAR